MPLFCITYIYIQTYFYVKCKHSFSGTSLKDHRGQRLKQIITNKFVIENENVTERVHSRKYSSTKYGNMKRNFGYRAIVITKAMYLSWNWCWRASESVMFIACFHANNFCFHSDNTNSNNSVKPQSSNPWIWNRPKLPTNNQGNIETRIVRSRKFS